MPPIPTDAENSSRTEIGAGKSPFMTYSQSRGASPAVYGVAAAQGPSILGRQRSNSAPAGPPGLFQTIGSSVGEDKKWTHSPLSSRFFPDEKDGLPDKLSLPVKATNEFRSPDAIADARIMSPVDASMSAANSVFRDNHGFGAGQGRGSFTNPDQPVLELGIAQEGRRSEGRGDGPSVVLNLDEQLQQADAVDEGDPLSPTTAQSLMYLLQEERQKFDALNAVRNQVSLLTSFPLLPVHWFTCPSPFISRSFARSLCTVSSIFSSKYYFHFSLLLCVLIAFVGHDS